MIRCSTSPVAMYMCSATRVVLQCYLVHCTVVLVQCYCTLHKLTLQWYTSNTVRSVHIRVPNRPKTGTLHLFMPFLNQCTNYKETLNSTHQYDHSTHNKSIRNTKNANWREEERENCSLCHAQNWVSYNVEFCMETAQRKLCYSTVLLNTAVLPPA